MITNFDDFCIHQTAAPVAQPSQSDRNFYDRYWFNGIDPGGTYLFEAGLGLYPNRDVMDAHFSVSLGGRQYAFHGSRRAPRERGETVVGPLAIEIVEPMRRIRLTLSPNEHNIDCDLEFTAASIPHEEPQNIMHDQGRLIMHSSRFTQMGYWSGYFSIDGNRVVVERAVGTRDKSWGIRPVGEPQGGAPGVPGSEPGVYWCWNPINFGDLCTQMGTFEDRDGNSTQVSADLLPLYDNHTDIPPGDDPGRIAFVDISHRIHWEPGTRRPSGAELQLVDARGRSYVIEMESILRFQVLGLGYNHPEWGHAVWQGEYACAREEWDLASLDPLGFENLHVHHAVRARMGDREGLGTLETLVIGRHEPSGFKDFMDGAA
jgi:hypothetical protein